MFDEEFILYPEEEDDHRAEYSTDDLKIRYIMPYITDGVTDLIKCINHEWLHGLIDWGLDHKRTEALRCFKNNWDPSGESDHFIMRLINYD